MEMAAATWKTPGWWKAGGGATVWDAITYDPVTDLTATCSAVSASRSVARPV